jgi:hypothetical protein
LLDRSNGFVVSASLTTRTGPTGLFGGGAAIFSGKAPTSIVPDSVLESRLATDVMRGRQVVCLDDCIRVLRRTDRP